MPFGGYKDFDECVSKNRHKDDPKAYCGTIKHKVEGGSITKSGAADPTFLSMQEEIEFNTEGDEKVCPICDDLDGTEYVEGSEPVLPDDTHPNCRCYYTYAGTGEVVAGVIRKGARIILNLPKKAKIVQAREKLKAEATQYTSSDRDAKTYIKRFLLDTSVNLNEWGVSEGGLENNINTFIGRPFVLYQNNGSEPDANMRRVGELDHPYYNENDSFDHNLMAQERYAIGRIIDITRKGTRFDAIIEITNKIAAEMIKKGDIPIYTSPALIHNPYENDAKIMDFKGVHLAAVGHPAFGVHKTSSGGMCDGTKASCMQVLRKASLAKGEDCGFCVKNALIKLADGDGDNDEDDMGPEHKCKQCGMKFDTKKELDEHNDMKHASLLTKSNSSINNSQVAKSKFSKLMDTQNPISTFTEAQVNEKLAGAKAEYEIKIKNLEAENTALKSTNESVQMRVAAIEKERRKEQISAIVTAELYSDKKVREEIVEKYTSSTIPVEDVKATFAPLMASMVRVKKASITYPTEENKTETMSEVAGFMPGVNA